MSVFKCKMCGGSVDIEPGATVGVCDWCGTKQTFPRLDDDRRANLYDRANHFRRNNEFDKAAAIYEQILNEDATDAEAYWSLVLCQYGIEYVEDPATHKRIPTVNRAQFTSIFDDGNYQSALQYADGYQRELYEDEAKAINEIQRGILAISEKEKPFDVFICYKETDANGRRTPDSVLANDLYHQLTQEGFKVFFARITLEDKLGAAYEPYIFAALNSSKVMVVLGTKPEHFNAVWVKNEWSRYLALVKQSGGKKVLIPAYKDMDPYDLPEEFSHLQAQDMSKLGFMQDLIRGIKKIVKAGDPKGNGKETVVIEGAVNIAPLLKRAFLFLEDGNWAEADEYCEKVLDRDPENGEAYLGKLMAELQVKSRERLADCAEPFDNRQNYEKVIRFGDEKLKAEMRDYLSQIKERNKNSRSLEKYNDAVKAMNEAKSEAQLKAAAGLFQTTSGFKDADTLAAQCLEKAESVRLKRKRRAKKAVKILIPVVSGVVALAVVFLILWFATPVWTLRYEANDDGGYTVYCNKDFVKSVTIPEKHLGKKVTSIGNSAFCYCTELSEITIPASVTSIEDCAFQDCSGLTKITIPASVTSIGNWVFAYCSNLNSITIPDSVQNIGYGAFDCCSGLTSVTIGNGVTSIGHWAFSDCYGLTSVIIGNGVTSIGDEAFSHCSGLTEIIIPDGVTSIGSSAFNGCSSLTSITIPDGVTSIEDEAFSHCSGLTSIAIPDGVTSIGKCAFSGCSGLTSIVIPDSVKSIGYATFSGCSALESITIPFVGAEAGKTASDTYQYPFGYIFGTRSYTGGTSTYQLYHASSTSSSTYDYYYIPSSLRSVTVTGGNILHGSFYNCSGLTSVTIGNGVTSIGNDAFEYCTGLTSFTIPDSVASIGNFAFRNCSGLTEITFTGTKADWYGIIKESFWDDGTGSYTVHCTDGDITKE